MNASTTVNPKTLLNLLKQKESLTPTPNPDPQPQLIALTPKANTDPQLQPWTPTSTQHWPQNLNLTPTMTPKP